MIKIIKILFICLIAFIAITVSFLSIKGIETDRFNKKISEKLKKDKPFLEVKFNKIKIKLDIKSLNLFGETNKPTIVYQKTNIPIKKIKIYINLLKLAESKNYLERVELSTEEINIEILQKVLAGIKPSNFKKFLLNNVSNGKVKSSINLEFDENFKIEKYKISGQIKKIDLKIAENILLKKTSFNYVSDNDLILINSIESNYKNIPIKNGTIKITIDDNYQIEGSVQSVVKLNNNELKAFTKKIKLKYLDNNIKISGNLLSKFKLALSSSLKIENYNFNIGGTIETSQISFSAPLTSDLLKNKIKNINFSKIKYKLILDSIKKNRLSLEGFYKTGNSKISKFNIQNIFSKNKSKYKINLDLNDAVVIDILNYKKNKNKLANIVADFEIEKSKLNIKKINYVEEKTKLTLNDLSMEKNKVKKFSNIKIITYNGKKKNNDLNIKYGKKILISGLLYDSTNLTKIISRDSKTNIFNSFNKEIEISFNKIFSKLSEPLRDFNLLGTVKKGKFIKILSKTELSTDKYLDISLSKLPNSNKKYLEIYSDKPKSLISDYDFFNGIEGGTLLYTTTFDDSYSSSNLLIKKFKVSKTPAFAKLLALADFRGMADMLKGDGISFDTLEIKFNKNKEVLNITELYAVGPSISILIEGYMENKTKLISLKGTMIPAKELNKLISRIPIIGNILIPKDIGEGLFGVSFKIKGFPGKTKTTVNPLKTLTPRFIQKAIGKIKNN